MKKLFVTLSVLAIAGCSNLNSNTKVDPYTGHDQTTLPTFVSQDFELSSYNGQMITSGGVGLSLRFEPVAGKKDELKISGRMCNTFFGQALWNANRSTLKAPQLASTRMFCEKEVLNELDQLVGRMFQEEVRVTTTASGLTLEGAGATLEYISVKK